MGVDESQRSFSLVVNPAAGGGRARTEVTTLIERLRSAGAHVDASYTDSLEHGTELAAELAGMTSTVVAVGGDGLVSAVVNGLAGDPTSTLAVVPMGTGNDFARALGITQKNAIDLLLEGQNVVRPIDLGHVIAADGTARHFTCIASVGLDSVVIESAMRTRLITGPLVYPYATLKCLSRWKPAVFTLDVDEDPETVVGFSVAVSNSGVYGGGMRLAPDADMNDGLLDVVTIDGRSKVHFLHQAMKVFHGGHVGSPHVRIRRARRVSIAVEPPYTVYADGEPVGPAPATIEVRPKALRVLVPPTSAAFRPLREL